MIADWQFITVNLILVGRGYSAILQDMTSAGVKTMEKHNSRSNRLPRSLYRKLMRECRKLAWNAYHEWHSDANSSEAMLAACSRRVANPESYAPRYIYRSLTAEWKFGASKAKLIKLLEGYFQE